jgi:hypothetical protein
MRICWTLALIAALVLPLAGCVGADVGPINVQTSNAEPPSPAFIPEAGDDGSTVVGLAFSGGGTRAAAFAYGALRELDDTVSCMLSLLIISFDADS